MLQTRREPSVVARGANQQFHLPRTPEKGFSQILQPLTPAMATPAPLTRGGDATLVLLPSTSSRCPISRSCASAGRSRPLEGQTHNVSHIRLSTGFRKGSSSIRGGAIDPPAAGAEQQAPGLCGCLFDQLVQKDTRSTRFSSPHTPFYCVPNAATATQGPRVASAQRRAAFFDVDGTLVDSNIVLPYVLVRLRELVSAPASAYARWQLLP